MIKLHILRASKNGVNGHLTIHAKIIEDRENGEHLEGAVESWGIDPLALQSRFDGDVHRWRAWVTDKMLLNHRHRSVVHESINGWTGKKFEIADPLRLKE